MHTVNFTISLTEIVKSLKFEAVKNCEILKSCNNETVKSWNQAFQYYVTVIAIQI